MLSAVEEERPEDLFSQSSVHTLPIQDAEKAAQVSRDWQWICHYELESVYEELRAEHGSLVDRARPYLDANQALVVASERLQTASKLMASAARRLKAVSPVEEPRGSWGRRSSRSIISMPPSAEAEEAQRHHEESRVVYTEALKAYSGAKRACDEARRDLGDADLRAVQPCFKRLAEVHRELQAQNKPES